MNLSEHILAATALDGFDLLTSDLDKTVGVQDWNLHDGGNPIKVLVRLDDGRRFMLIAEEQS